MVCGQDTVGPGETQRDQYQLHCSGSDQCTVYCARCNVVIVSSDGPLSLYHSEVKAVLCIKCNGERLDSGIQPFLLVFSISIKD